MKKFLLLTLAISCQFLFAQNIIYVNHAATGANDGSSWVDAYVDFQSALDTAQSGEQIWVAQGTYYPSKVTTPNASHPLREIGFRLANSVEHYGGFAGNETSLNQRDWRLNKTILSGNIGDKTISTDNSATVVFNDNKLSAQTVLDGFTITEGNHHPYREGGNGYGGMYTEGAAVFRNLHITKNIGRGVFCLETKNSFVNCRIDSNDLSNRSRGRGVVLSGALYTFDTAYFAFFTNCFIGNNVCSGNYPSLSPYHSEIFVVGELKVVMSGCTIDEGQSRNSVSLGNASRAPLIGADISFYNCIVNDSVVFIPLSAHQIKFKNSLVRHTAGGFYIGADLGGNIDTVPGFVAPGDFRLKYNSAAIDAGSLDSIPQDIWDLDNDGITSELIPYDLSGNPRIVNNRPDMGAYEFLEAWNDTTAQILCAGEKELFYGSEYDSSGVYRYGISQDSAHYLNLTVDVPNTDVQVWFGGILEAKADSASYRWIDCNDTTINFGVTDKIFYPSQPGSYAVIITTPNGCVDTSACFHVSNISLSENTLDKEISIYPNPVDGLLHVAFSEEKMDKQTVLKVLDVNGKTVLQRVIATKGEKEITLDVESLAKGVYFLKVGSSVLRFVKE